MPFGTFALISLFYAVIGLRVVRDLWVRRHEVFDLRLTEADRFLVDQAAFFLLVPISVALHELGHAVAIWSFGGHVVAFSYWVFAGSVSYDDPFTNVQHIVVAAAGTIVNVILCALALGVVFLKRRPLRAAINELLFQFAVISGVNALVVYPLLDVATGMEGDWTQMYNGGVPALSLAIGVIHAAILIGAYVAWNSPGFRRRLAARTAMPIGTDRRLFGGLRRSGTPAGQAGSETGTADFTPASPAEARFRAAADRVARGWGQPVQGRIDRRDEGTQVALVWVSGDTQRAVAMRQGRTGQVSISGAAATVSPNGNGAAPSMKELRSWPDLPDENDLTIALRMAMEAVESWQPGAPAAPAPFSRNGR